MRWLIIPHATSVLILNSESARNALVRHLASSEILNSGLLGIDGAFPASILEIDKSTGLLTVWPNPESKDIPLAHEPLLSIWSEANQSTLWTLPEEELSNVLERVCLLADRAWAGHTLPSRWTHKKVASHHSIFAGDLRLKDLRLAYEVNSFDGHNVLHVGSLFYAYRQEKNIKVPVVPEDVLALLPASVTRPSGMNFQGATSQPNTANTAQLDRDLVVPAVEGENRHLFSMRYSDWLSNDSPLTQQQRRAVKQIVDRPIRIHGPAGSGKTLVLILKAIDLLRAAQDAARECKVLLVLNSNSIRNTVRTAIEAIDESGFLATTKSDLQFLDVETLHSWCLRELGLEQGPNYILHSDPLVSRMKQDEILAGILDQIISTKIIKMGTLLSSDLRAHFNGPRERLITNMRYEIAIRIKGRGLRKERQLYVDSQINSFVGRGENAVDRFLLFDVFEAYEKALLEQNLLDTDDVVLSMQPRLAAPLWERQRETDAYDYVLVDEAHLFNENERRVLPYLTRGGQKYFPIVMTFDEVQSIGGRRPVDLERVGITNSSLRTLTYVHRSSPDIFMLARDLVERSALVFSEFGTSEAVPRMSERDVRKCQKPQLLYCEDDNDVAQTVGRTAANLRSRNYPRVGVITFDIGLLYAISAAARDTVHVVKERGELIAAVPTPGIYLMTAENCGGLEFDAVILAGVDEGRVPPSMRDLSPEGHLSIREEAFKELYTGITRARYSVYFVCTRQRGLSSLVIPSLNAGYIVE
jgi:superfamily I DNA/RNA helicase